MQRKKSILPSVLLLLCLEACQPKQPNVSGPPQMRLPYLDSLIKYQDTTDVNAQGWVGPNSSEGLMFMTTINGARVAIISFEDNTLYCFRKNQSNWVLCDSYHTELHANEMCHPDLNGDGFDDIRVSWPVMRGNYICEVLLYQPRSGMFKHDRYYDRMNIGYDSVSGLVRVSGLGGLYDNVKELYKITGDSLTFYKSVEMSLDVTGRTGELNYYENLNGKKKRARTVKEAGNKVFADFDSTFWDNGLEYFGIGNCF